MNNSKKLFSILVTMMMVFMIFFSGPVTAVTVGLQETSSDNAFYFYEAYVDIHEPDKVRFDVAAVQIYDQTDDNEIWCYYNKDNKMMVGNISTNIDVCSGVTITSIENNAPINITGPFYGYGYGYYYDNASVGRQNVTWENYGYAYLSGYGYDNYADSLVPNQLTDGEIMIEFNVQKSSLSPNHNYYVRAGIAGYNGSDVHYVYINENDLNPITGSSNMGGGMQHIDTHESSIVPAYLEKGETGNITFQIKKLAPDENYCMHNITIIMPESSDNITFNNYLGSTTENFSFSNATVDGKVNLIFKNNSGFMCGNTVWANFTINVTSNRAYGSSVFEVRANGTGFNLFKPDNDKNFVMNKSLYSVRTFDFPGHIYDFESKQPIPGAVGSMTVRTFTRSGDVNFGTFSAVADANGTFNISGVPGLYSQEEIDSMDDIMGGPGEGLFYQLSTVSYNDTPTNYFGMYTGPNLPDLGEAETRLWLANSTVYLKPAATFHLKTRGYDYQAGGYWNGSAHVFNITNTGYGYSIKDDRMGYEISSDWTFSTTERYFSVPLGRNYTVMVYPQMSFPVSLSFENISDRCNTSGYNLSDAGLNANCTIRNGTYFIDAEVTTTMEPKQLNGSINLTDVDSFTVIGYLIEGDDMIFDFGQVPFNFGQMEQPNKGNNSFYNDNYNLTNGTFNVWLPATSATSNILLMAYAKKGSTYYRDILKIVSANTDFDTQDVSLSMIPLINGVDANLTGKNVSGGWNESVIGEVSKVKFNMVNSNGTLLTTESGFYEINMEEDGTSYKLMGNAANGTFTLPVPDGYRIKKLTIYSQSYAPLSTPVSSSVLAGTSNSSGISCNSGICNVTMRSFDPFDPETGSITDIQMDILTSNSTCDVPNPPAGCSHFDGLNKTEFNPFKAILAGDVSMRISSGNLSVHFIKTDLMASGPPDAAFSQNNTGSDLAAAWKFGSSGPEIYSGVLLSVPYSNDVENMTLEINIDVLYDNDFNVFWNRSVNTTAQLVGTDYEDYLSNGYQNYLNGNGVACSTTDGNMTTALCYKDTTNQVIWMKIPHFSGVGPVVSQYTAPSTDDSSGSSGGSGGSGGGSYPTDDSADDGSDDSSGDDDSDAPVTQMTEEQRTENVLESVPEGYIDVEKEGEPKNEVITLEGDELKAAIDEVMKTVTEEKAKEALEQLKAKVESGEIKDLSVSKRLDVYKVSNPDTGDSVYRSMITLTFAPEEDMEDIRIVETIPKDIAADAADLEFPGEAPIILQADPIVEWTFDSVKAGEVKDLSYVVKKKIETLETTTITGGTKAVAEVEETKDQDTTDTAEIVDDTSDEDKKKSNAWMWIVLVLVVVGGGVALYLYENKKK